MDAEKQALAIYESICASSEDRPFAFQSMEQLLTDLSAWRAKNQGLVALLKSEPAVQTAFLKHSFEWLNAEAKVDRNFRVCQTMMDAINIALDKAPKPLPNDLVLKLLSEYRQQFSMARMYFPFLKFLSAVRRDQVTGEIRGELRKLQPQFAPSPTGKIDPNTVEFRTAIEELARTEGEPELDPGRGPWSQIVFDELGDKDEVTRAGWEALLEHCRNLEQTVPGTKWNKRSRELAQGLGAEEVVSTFLRWLALGPTPCQPKEARSPIEDSAYQKGVLWCLAPDGRREVAVAVGDFAIACLRKIPMMGAVSQKVGFAGVQVLGVMDCPEAVTQLTRLRTKVKYTVARRLIEKSLQQAADRSGLSTEELEEICVPRFAFNEDGVHEIAVGDCSAIIKLCVDGRVAVLWKNADGKLVKSVPGHVKKGFAHEVRSVAALAKDTGETYLAQRARLEAQFISVRKIPAKHWREYFIEHPLLGFLGRKLIWAFSNDEGWESSGIWNGKAICDSHGRALDTAKADRVRLWHPLSAQLEDTQEWRERVFSAGIRQPIKQAFREFYQVTDGERETRMYSNRFAGIFLRQHQLASLCRARGWEYRLMGTGFDGGNVPTRKLTAWNMDVEFHVDLPPDRNQSLRDSGLGEQSGSGINLFVCSDQVRFYRNRNELAIEEVPAIVYSEIMRDVDLFTSVCGIGEDETWSDQGDRSTGALSRRFDMHETSALIALRAEVVSRVLPHTSIADRCVVQKDHLQVKGQLGLYQIHFAWAGALLQTDTGPRWLIIPTKLLNSVKLELDCVPIELDYRTELVLRKAYLLANDWKLDDPNLIRQFMPE